MILELENFFFLKFDFFNFFFFFYYVGSSLWHWGFSFYNVDLLLRLTDSLVVVCGLSSCSPWGL